MGVGNQIPRFGVRQQSMALSSQMPANPAYMDSPGKQGN